MGNNDTELSLENILNRSYDPALDVLVVENIGANGVLINPATEAKQDDLINYNISDLDEANDTKYYGFVDKAGNWYIQQLTSTTARYISGSADYVSNWENRDGLTYDYYFNIF